MPEDDARKAAGQRLAADLRSEREERGFSADDLRQRLNVPGRLLQDFESGRLVGHPLFNRVYLRSLTRSYAGAMGVPAASALAALEAALDGTYEKGQLQREIESHERPEHERPEQAVAAQETAGQASSEREATEEHVAGEGPAEAGGEPDWTMQSPPGASAAEAQKREREKEERAQARERERQERAEAQQRERETRARRQAGRSRQEDDRPARQQRRRSGVWSSWAVTVLVVVGGVIGAFFLIRSLVNGSETAQTTAVAPDTAASGERTEAQGRDRRPPANLQLDEQMDFTVVAQKGGVQGIRITRDEDVRRPYWIEQGQAQVFPASQRIILEDTAQLNKIRLLAEGYPYPTNRRDAQGRVVITRQDMQAFADTLRGSPVSLSVQPDTIPKGAPPGT